MKVIQDKLSEESCLCFFARFFPSLGMNLIFDVEFLTNEALAPCSRVTQKPLGPKQNFGLDLRTCQELFEAQGYVTIPVVVVFFKDIRHSLENNTALHKEIEAHAVSPTLIVRAEEEGDEGGGEAVAKSYKSFSIFGMGDISALVFVKAVKEGPPRA